MASKFITGDIYVGTSEPSSTSMLWIVSDSFSHSVPDEQLLSSEKSLISFNDCRQQLLIKGCDAYNQPVKIYEIDPQTIIKAYNTDSKSWEEVNYFVDDLEQLMAPTNLTVDGTTVSFDEVENATSYEVLADGESIGTVENESGSTDATVIITNTSTEYDANVGTSNDGYMANSDIGIVGKNSTKTFTIPKGTVIYISANTGNGYDIWVTTSITGEIVGEINAGGAIGELTINGNGTITGYAYNND